MICPETIGSICYLSHHEDLISEIKGGIFIEMPGNRNILALQRTRQDEHLMDRITRYVLKRRKVEFREDAYLNVARNDEKVINGPGVNIPCISLSRWLYDEHHTSDDNPDIVHEDLLVEVADVVEEVIRVSTSNYIPRRKFRGPVFLSKFELWVDWKKNWDLNKAQEQIMLMLEGEHSIFDISQDVGVDYWEVKNLVDKLPIRDPVGEI